MPKRGSCIIITVVNGEDKMLYVVTNRHLAGTEFLIKLEKIAASHPHFIQLREKDLPPYELYALAQEIKRITDYHKVGLIINGSVEVALAVGSAGVHLGYQSLSVSVARSLIKPGQLLGMSVHSPQEAVGAQKDGAHYLIAGHVYATDCKAGLEARGLEFLRNIRQAVSIPVFAIGGIDLSRVKAVMETGVDGIAIMSGLMKDQVPNELVCNYYKLMDKR